MLVAGIMMMVRSLHLISDKNKEINRMKCAGRTLTQQLTQWIDNVGNIPSSAKAIIVPYE
jgi:hypothetical protein